MTLLVEVSRLPRREPKIEDYRQCFAAVERGEVREEYAQDAYERYVELFEARSLLECVADYNGPSNYPAHAFKFRARLEVDANGLLQLGRNSILKCIVGLPVNQIRACAICSNLFWASRLTQVCCSKRCAGMDRTRRWRQKKDKYKINRYIKGEKQK